MCPCPFCATIAIIMLLMLPFKKSRQWLKKKLQKHHKNCTTCQEAEHNQCQKEHVPCTCQKCRQHRKK